VLPLLKPKKKSTLGIDINSSSVKILQLSHHGLDYCVEHYASYGLSVGMQMSDLAAVIKKLISSNPFTNQSIVVAVPNSSTISKVIQINQETRESDLESLVLLEAEQSIPYPLDEINLDYTILGPSSKKSDLQDLLIIASRAENVNARVEPIKLAGLEVNVVDVESYAIERAVQLIKSQLPSLGLNSLVVIIDFGSSHTRCFFLYNLKVLCSQEEDYGENQLINDVMRYYGLSHQEAQLFFEENCFFDGSSISPIASRSIEESDVRGAIFDDYQTQILFPFIKNISLQVKRTLQFFYSSSEYSSVNQLVLAGGIARHFGISQLFEDNLGLPTIIANPMAAVTFHHSVDRELLLRESPNLMMVCGLALRQVQ